MSEDVIGNLITTIFQSTMQQQEKESALRDIVRLSPGVSQEIHAKQIPAKGILKFTKKELRCMSTNIQNYFLVEGKTISYRLKPNGTYEARLRTKEIHIEVSSKSFRKLKELFTQRLMNYTSQNVQSIQTIQNIKPAKQISISFKEFTLHWLSFKEKLVKPSTFKEYVRLCNHDLIPTFGESPISQIDRATLQNYLYDFISQGKNRTAKKLFDLLRCIFELAAEDYNFPSPMTKVVLPKYQQKKGKALTKTEELKLVNYCIQNHDKASSSALLVLLYFGMRQSELATLKVIDENWIECITSKERLGQNEVPRRIPITPMVKTVLPYIDFDKAKATVSRTIASTLGRLFDHTHHPHELRYTYITRCKECGVNPEVVMLWDGHEQDKDVKSSRVDRGYTDYSEEYLLKEAAKVQYDIRNIEE